MPRTARSRTVALLVAIAAVVMLYALNFEPMGINLPAILSFVFVTLVWILFVGGAIWLAVEFFGVVNSRKSNSNDNAVSTLRERYARGEINRAEYFQMLQDLEFDK